MPGDADPLRRRPARCSGPISWGGSSLAVQGVAPIGSQVARVDAEAAPQVVEPVLAVERVVTAPAPEGVFAVAAREDVVGALPSMTSVVGSPTTFSTSVPTLSPSPLTPSLATPSMVTVTPVPEREYETLSWSGPPLNVSEPGPFQKKSMPPPP
jgi:hypothetical protein